jgi:hypothetical protein
VTAEEADPVRIALPSGEVVSGRVADLRGATASADDLRRAVRGGRPVPDDAPEVVCPPPGPVHRYVEHLSPAMAFDRRGALATVARTRGFAAPDADELEAVRAKLAETRLAPPVETATARRRAAEAGAETERLRERVATLRGRLSAHRERAAEGGDDAGVDPDADVAAVEATLSEAMRRLSEVSTDRIAARQRLELLESESRAGRDRREERLRLEDRVGNLERAVRRSLAGCVYDEFAGAVAALPSEFDAEAGDEPGEYDGPAVAAALAVARVADPRAPVVVAADVAAAFGGPAGVGAFLRAPVVVR